MLDRIRKTLIGLLGAQGLHLVQQIITPPIFLYAYGVDSYALWLVLTSAVGYVSTLDFGLQTYVATELTMYYHREDLYRYRLVQSTSFKTTVGIILIASVASIGLFALPLDNFLGLKTRAPGTSITVLLLIYQGLLAVSFGQIHTLFRTIDRPARSVTWQNISKACILVATIIPVALRESFWIIALSQMLTTGCLTLACMMELHKTNSKLFFDFGQWDWKLSKSLLRHSVPLSSGMLNNFLLFQVPVIVLNKYIGPTMVVSFTLGRSLFSFAREAVGTIANAIAPEISRIFALRNSDHMRTLYESAEIVVFSSSLVVNLTVLALSPALLRIWIGRSDLFDPTVFGLLMVTSVLMNVKYLKLVYQFYTNNHVISAATTVVSYLLMIGISVLTIRKFGVTALMVCWTLAEIIQIILINKFNSLVLGFKSRGIMVRLVKLFTILCLSILLWCNVLEIEDWKDSAEYMASSIAGTIFLAGLSVYFFGLTEFLGKWKASQAFDLHA